MSFIEWLQVLGPPLAVYIGIRTDLAAMKIRLDHLERDLYDKARVTRRPG